MSQHAPATNLERRDVLKLGGAALAAATVASAGGVGLLASEPAGAQTPKRGGTLRLALPAGPLPRGERVGSRHARRDLGLDGGGEGGGEVRGPQKGRAGCWPRVVDARAVGAEGQAHLRPDPQLLRPRAAVRGEG